MKASQLGFLGQVTAYGKDFIAILKETYITWIEVEGSLLAAGLSYFAILSLTPLLIIAITIAGLVFEEEVASQKLVEYIGILTGDRLAVSIETLLQTTNTHPSTASITAIVSLLALLFGASMLFVQLKSAINLLWGIVPQRNKTLLATMRVQFLSFAIVLGIGLLLLVSMLASTFLIAFNHFIDPLPQILQDRFPQFNFGVAFAMSAIFFAIIFKFLPDARIAWRDVLVGAAVTSLLFTTGELLIGRYLGRVNLSQGYGAASSLILILLWVYLSMQIILLGAKFTQVYANHHGSKVVPSQRAEIIVRQRINHHHK